MSGIFENLWEYGLFFKSFPTVYGPYNRHVIYRWKALDLSLTLMTLIYPARYLPKISHSLKFPVP